MQEGKEKVCAGVNQNGVCFFEMCGDIHNGNMPLFFSGGGGVVFFTVSESNALEGGNSLCELLK